MLLYVILIVLTLKPYFSLGFTADEVTHLPGLAKQPTFRQYSGYLNASKGRYYHYWFVESQSNPQKDPVILFLNGGPGASSLIALLLENGPFRVHTINNVTEDQNSWNSIANVLYLESPVGVGYSYGDHKNYSNNDDSTAEDNYLALNSFFRKFPQFSRNEFYITGESYAGVYVPMLAIKIYENNSTINLKGLAIGNGALDQKLILNSKVRMAYTHGLIAAEEWHQLVRDCCSCDASGEQVCNFHQDNNTECNGAKMIKKRIQANGVNPYNIYKECDPLDGYSADESTGTTRLALDLKTYFGAEDGEQYYSTKTNCPDNPFEKYLNLPSVRTALHIPVHVQAWAQASDVNYTIQYSNMRSEFKQLIEKYKIQAIIVYKGDNDIVCDFLGDQQFVDELGLKPKHKYQKWTVGARVAGFVKRYEGISFMTVRNAGHLVPTDQPEAALAIVKELIGVSKVV